MDVSSTKNNKTVLILHILEEHFGDIVKDVAETILLSEYCTLGFIVRTLNGDDSKKLDIATIRQALVVLLHHNCLIVEMMDIEGDDTNLTMEERARSSGLLYRLHIDNIMNRMRFCTLLKIVNEKFSHSNKKVGEIAVLIVEEVILHGRVRLPQIRQAVTQTLSNSDSNFESHAVVQDTFEQLVQNRFIIAVPQLDIKKRGATAVEGVKTKAKNFFNAATSNATVVAASAKKNVTTAASLSSSTIGGVKRSRKDVDAELEDEQELLPVEMRMMNGGNGSTVSEEPLAKSVKVEAAESATTGRATKGGRLGGRLGGRGGRGGRGASSQPVSAGLDLDSANIDEVLTGVATTTSSSGTTSSAVVVNSVVREEKMWMVCWDQLIREERHAFCKQVTSDRMESMAGVIVSVILESSMNTELGGNQAKSAPMCVKDILSGVNKKIRQDKGRVPSKKGDVDKMEEPALKKLLEFMRLSATSLLIKAVGSDGAEGGPSYMVNMEAIVQLLVRKTIHNIAISRYGDISGRIIELLQRSKYVDQQTVSDMIILPARETRERLYKLYLDKWVGYLELSKRGDFNPSSNYYFWYLDLPKLTAAVLDHFYKSIYNLRLRRADEVLKGKQLLDFAITNEADEIKYKALITRLNMLDDAVIKLDNTVLVLEKF